MPSLKEILFKVSIKAISGDMDKDIVHITTDSRKVDYGSLFIAIKGTEIDSHNFIPKAIEQGASAIVCQEMPEERKNGVTYVNVNSSREAVGYIASNFYRNPSDKLQLVGITGTNGKTSVATLGYRLLTSMGYRCGLISTVKNLVAGRVIESTHTTPDPIALNKLLREMKDNGCTHVFMEVSSHAIHQRRIAGLDFNIAVFTNITHDHLDYHGTFQNYIDAKKLFFDDLPSSAKALINKDDKRGMYMVQNTRAIYSTFSLQQPADFQGKIVSNTLEGLEIELDQNALHSLLVGKFNAYNLLSVYAIGMFLNEPQEEILQHISLLKPAEGRFERLVDEKNRLVVIDYAHTPDALDNVLNTITDLRTRNELLITVIGAGGNRDKSKRPLMAETAVKYSDVVIFTSDNPRDEEPDKIIEDMLEGVRPKYMKNVKIIVDRSEAIQQAISSMKPNDICLIAGKGHEKYQEIKGVKHPFDDKEIANELLLNT